jgi:hypothetical protein
MKTKLPATELGTNMGRSMSMFLEGDRVLCCLYIYYKRADLQWFALPLAKAGGL